MSLLLILSHLLAASAGAVAMAGYAMFLLAAAIWSKEDDDDRDLPAGLPTPSDPPSAWKPLPRPDPSSATPSSSPAPAAGQTASAPAATTPPEPAMPTSAKQSPAPPSISASPASSAPPSAAPEALATFVLDGGPHDGLALRADPAKPILRIKSTVHGLHRYIATDRFDLNRRVCIHAGPEPLS